MIAFMDNSRDKHGHRDKHGVEPICEALPITPASHYEHLARRVDPARLSDRARQDEALRPHIPPAFDEALFRNLAPARALIAAWMTDCYTGRPHSALACQTPAEFALHMTTAIARSAARDESSARRAIAQPAPRGGNDHQAPVVAAGKTSGRSPGKRALRPNNRSNLRLADKILLTVAPCPSG